MRVLPCLLCPCHYTLLRYFSFDHFMVSIARSYYCRIVSLLVLLFFFVSASLYLWFFISSDDQNYTRVAFLFSFVWFFEWLLVCTLSRVNENKNTKWRRPYYQFDSTKYMYVCVNIEEKAIFFGCLLLLFLSIIYSFLIFCHCRHVHIVCFFCSFTLYKRNQERNNIAKYIVYQVFRSDFSIEVKQDFRSQKSCWRIIGSQWICVMWFQLYYQIAKCVLDSQNNISQLDGVQGFSIRFTFFFLFIDTIVRKAIKIFLEPKEKLAPWVTCTLSFISIYK